MSSSFNSVKIFDRDLVAKRLEKRLPNSEAKQNNCAGNFIVEMVNNDLLDRLSIISRSFEKAAIIGPVASYLPKSARSASGKFCFSRFATLIAENEAAVLDAENLQLPHNNYDLIVSLLDLQIVDNVPQYLQNIRNHLRPDGLMILAAIGGNSLIELKKAWLNAESELYNSANARVIPFIDIKQAGSLLQNSGFTLPVADIDSHRVRYKSPLALMQELRDFAASNPLFEKPKKLVTNNLLKKVSEKYNRLAQDEDGRISASLEILWLSGWAQHESQRNPLKPGSAQISLSKVLANKQ